MSEVFDSDFCNIKEKIVKEYFQSWIENDIDVISSIFAENIVYSECYGPEYHGIQQMRKWFSDWNRVGRVLEWNVKGIIHQGNITVVEWYFKCSYRDVTDHFNGVSIVEFDCDMKITNLKEFQSKYEHNYPYEQPIPTN